MLQKGTVFEFIDTAKSTGIRYYCPLSANHLNEVDKRRKGFRWSERGKFVQIGEGIVQYCRIYDR